MRAWLVSCAQYAAVQLAKGVVFSGLVASALAPGLVMLGAQRALGWRPTFAAAAPSPKDYHESPDDIAADASIHAHGGSYPSVLPDPALTPGSVRTTDKAGVCMDRHTRQYRHWSRARDDPILAEYGLPAGPHPSYEVDHLIPLDLGGADDDSNLWPEPRRSIEPEWNAERKDRLEWRMAGIVCGGQLDLAAAQKAIRDNWVDAYRTYIGER